MEMENRFKLRISRMFQSSFSSCRTRNISDAVEKPVFILENHKCSPYQSIQGAIINNLAPREKTLPSRKVSTYTDFNGRFKCCSPPAPLNLFSDCNHFDFYEKKKSLTKTKKKKKKNSKRVHVKCNNNNKNYLSSNTLFFTSSSHYWFITSDEDDETETLFSSKTLSSSDSSEPRDRIKHNTRRRRRGVVKDSFAVVKSSDDPYNDFRASMVEMIVERQIFGAKELEQLLECFLSLNSRQHHEIIVEVFTEICETLFSNLS